MTEQTIMQQLVAFASRLIQERADVVRGVFRCSDVLPEVVAEAKRLTQDDDDRSLRMFAEVIIEQTCEQFFNDAFWNGPAFDDDGQRILVLGDDELIRLRYATLAICKRAYEHVKERVEAGTITAPPEQLN